VCPDYVKSFDEETWDVVFECHRADSFVKLTECESRCPRCYRCQQVTEVNDWLAFDVEGQL
jgi:Zn finger protein HypA/HybF involved in hydrogenase expression